MRNPYFNDTLATMAQLHDRKNHDYAEDDNPFSNFEMAASYASVPVQKVFDVLLGVKQARIDELTAKIANGDPPRNESLEDSRLDRAVYAALSVAYSRRQAYIEDRQKAINALDYPGLDAIPMPGTEWDDYVYPTRMIPGSAYKYDTARQRFVEIGGPEDDAAFLATNGYVPDPWPCPHGQPCECANPTVTEAQMAEQRMTRGEYYGLGEG
jgi:hypothetical protein